MSRPQSKPESCSRLRRLSRSLKIIFEIRTTRSLSEKPGISGEIARDFGLGYAPDEWQHLSSKLEKNGFSQVLINCGLITTNDRGRHYDRFRGRITFPIRNIRGKTIGFGGRILRDGAPNT